MDSLKLTRRHPQDADLKPPKGATQSPPKGGDKRHPQDALSRLFPSPFLCINYIYVIHTRNPRPHPLFPI